LQKPFVMTVDIDPPPFSEPNLDISKGTLDLLKLFDKHKLKATFFVPACIASKFPELLKQIARNQHEIACHGLLHDPREGTMAFDDENRMIHNATEEIETITGSRPIGFRAPLFKIKKACLLALCKNDYVYDSSYVPSPFHGNYGFGLRSKPHYLFNLDNGRDKNLIEIPVSVNPFLPLPLGGTYMRVFGLRWAKMGVMASSSLGGPVVFYVHPKDVISRNSGLFWYSYRNTSKCLRMLDLILQYATRHRMTFLKASDLTKSPGQLILDCFQHHRGMQTT
jgi:hypothetical protein